MVTQQTAFANGQDFVYANRAEHLKGIVYSQYHIALHILLRHPCLKIENIRYVTGSLIKLYIFSSAFADLFTYNAGVRLPTSYKATLNKWKSILQQSEVDI